MQTSIKLERIKILGSGICGLMLMLGLARFAYTPLMPLMQQQADLSLAAGGWLASINYMGYLSGVMLAASISYLPLKFSFYRAGIILAVLTTVGMGWVENIYVWGAMRYFAGLGSAAGVMFGSGLILHWLMKNDLRSELGIHFSGAGLGIALCAITIELAHPQLDWRQQWYLLAAMGVLLAIPAWVYIPRPHAAEPIIKVSKTATLSPDAVQVNVNSGTLPDNPPSKLFVRLFMAFYGCAGVGYVISATFIVAIINDQTQGESGNLAFLLMGLAAAPACIFWDLIARRIGDIHTLMALSALHFVGIVLPVFVQDLWAAYLSCVLFGGTFIGLVSMVLTMAGRYLSLIHI